MNQKISPGLQQQVVNKGRELRWIWPFTLCLGNWFLWNVTCDLMFPFSCIVGISSSWWLQPLRSADSLSRQAVRIGSCVNMTLEPTGLKKEVKMYKKLSATTQGEILLRSSNLISSSTQIPFPLGFFYSRF